MGPEKEKEQEIVGSFNSMNINPLPAMNTKEINTSALKESAKTQQSSSSNTPQNSKQSFTTPATYDSSRIAEYILNALPETPGEDDLFESFLKNRGQMAACNGEERPSDFGIIESNSTSHLMKNGGGQSLNNKYIPQKRSKTPLGYSGASDPVIISDEDEERDVRRVSKSMKYSSNGNSSLNEEEESYDGSLDHVWITEKERM
ncbi:2618_t:CDS:2, partial [Acaulospora colombiana]